MGEVDKDTIADGRPRLKFQAGKYHRNSHSKKEGRTTQSKLESRILRWSHTDECKRSTVSEYSCSGYKVLYPIGNTNATPAKGTVVTRATHRRSSASPKIIWILRLSVSTIDCLSSSEVNALSRLESRISHWIQAQKYRQPNSVSSVSYLLTVSRDTFILWLAFDRKKWHRLVAVTSIN